MLMWSWSIAAMRKLPIWMKLGPKVMPCGNLLPLCTRELLDLLGHIQHNQKEAESFKVQQGAR